MNWVEKFQKGELTEEMELEEKVREYEAKIASLERKVGQLIMETDLLKKRPPITKTNELQSIISGPTAAQFEKDAKL